MNTSPEPIAIVGIGCRVPGAHGPDGFWRLLLEGVDAITEAPADRWDVDALYHPDPAAPGRMSTRWGGFLTDLDAFDSDFFAIAPVEAASMDPQQRLVLVSTYEALQDAGIPAASLAGSRTGVFIGASSFDHGIRQLGDTALAGPYTGTGSVLSIIANRVSYAFDLRGPSVTVDTACSSSLAAVHVACQALRSGEVPLAVAGGVSVLLNPNPTIAFSKGGFMAADGRCKTFDHRADGYVRSEGVGVVVLRRLRDALEARDRIYAVIRGSAVNQDGRSNGLFAPNRLAQEDLLREAYRNAGVDPLAVDYVEAHGTGTALGDPIEVGALATVLASGRDGSHPLLIGSVKSNIGHLEAAAGIAGLIKTTLCLYHRTLVPSIHVERPNPLLRLDRVPVRVQTTVRPWPEGPGRTPLAGVSSFGFGGANAHVVLSGHVSATPDSDAAAPGGPAPGPYLIPLSAKTADAVRALARDWATAVAEVSDDRGGLAAVAATAAHRRDHHDVRAAVVARTPAEASEAMRAVAAGKRHPMATTVRRVGRHRPRPVFIFPGQGGQWRGMGRRLAEACPHFRAALERCDHALAQVLGRRLFDPDVGLTFDDAATLQPAIFAMQVALAESWRARGVEPYAVVGHSLGEVAAAHVAGALDLADAVRVICARSLLLGKLEGTGGMLMTELSPQEAAELVEGEDDLAVAAVNGPRATVLAGGLEALARVERLLERRQVFHRRVAVGFAAHSPHVAPLQPLLRDALQGISPTATRVPFHSTVTGGEVPGDRLDVAYWVDNLRQTVQFGPVVQRLYEQGHALFVEISPHPVVARTLSEAMPEATVVASADRDLDEHLTFQRGLAEVYTLGVTPRWDTPRRTAPAPLPTYPWQPRPYPLRPVPPGGFAGDATSTGAGGVLDRPVRRPGHRAARIYPIRGSRQDAGYLADHVVEEEALAPAALWVSAMVEAARREGLGPHLVLRSLEVSEPLVVPERPEHRQVQLEWTPQDADSTVTVVSYPRDGDGAVHARAALGPAPDEELGVVPVDELRSRLRRAVDVAEFYRQVAGTGVAYGPSFRGLREIHAGEGEALAAVELPEAATVAHTEALVHPAFLDACLQAIGAALPPGLVGSYLPLPVALRQLRLTDVPTGRLGWCHVRIGAVTAAGADGALSVVADLTGAAESGAVRWRAVGVEIRLLPRDLATPDLLTLTWSRYTPGPVATAGRWLILSDDDATANPLRDRLADAGAAVTTSLTGGPDAPLAESLARLASEHGPVGILCTWGIEPDVAPERAPADQADRTVPERALRLAGRLLRLLQTLASLDWPAPPRLVVLTSAGQRDGRASLPPPVGGALWGLGRCAANEAVYRTTLVELPLPLSGDTAAHLMTALLDPHSPDQLSVDAQGCWSPALAVVPDDGDAAAFHARKDRSYLVTGGFGFLGRAVADWLVERGARHLILVGRNGPDEAAEAQLERWRRHGVAVECARVDVADVDALSAAADRWRDALPPLAGVVHCAGALADAPLADTTEEHLARTFAGKVTGAWHLHRLTEGTPLDLFVLFSSFAGVVGSPGQSAYAAANTALDALASYRRARGEPAVSIAWGTWAGGGLGTSTGGAERLIRLGVLPLGRAQGLDLLDRAVRAGHAQVGAVLLDPRRFDAAHFGPAAELVWRALARPGLSTADGAAGDAGAAVEPRELVRRAVADVIGSDPDQVPYDTVFADLGFNSLMVMALRRRLEQVFGTPLSSALVWEHPTVDALAAELQRRGVAGSATVAPRPPDVPAGAHADAGDRLAATATAADAAVTAEADERFDAVDDAGPVAATAVEPPATGLPEQDDDDLVSALAAQIALMKGMRG